MSTEAIEAVGGGSRVAPMRLPPVLNSPLLPSAEPSADLRPVVVEVSQAARTRAERLRKAELEAASIQRARPIDLSLLPSAYLRPDGPPLPQMAVNDLGQRSHNDSGINARIQRSHDRPFDHVQRLPHELAARRPGRATEQLAERTRSEPNASARVARGERIFDASAIRDPNADRYRQMQDAFMTQARS